MYQGYPVGLQLIREERGQGWDKAGHAGSGGSWEELGLPPTPECSGSHAELEATEGYAQTQVLTGCRLAAGVGGQTVGMRAEGAVLIKAGGWPRVARSSQILDMFKDRANRVS